MVYNRAHRKSAQLLSIFVERSPNIGYRHFAMPSNHSNNHCTMPPNNGSTECINVNQKTREPLQNDATILNDNN